MKKSPLKAAMPGTTDPLQPENTLAQLGPGEVLQGAAQAIQGGVKTQSLRDTPNALMGDGSEAVAKHEEIYKHIKKDVNPSFETAVQGDIMQSTGGVTQSAYEKPLGEVFKDGTLVAAENMFGAAVPGNFGRSMGG